MATKNDITGDALISRTSEAYRNNYDAIFGKNGKKNKCKEKESVENKETVEYVINADIKYPYERLREEK